MLLDYISSSVHRNDYLQTIKSTFLLYRRITEQYQDLETLKTIRLLIPEYIILQTKKDDQVISLLKWFKNDFMSWTSKDPICKRCTIDDADGSNDDGHDGRRRRSRSIPMQVQIETGSSWKLRSVEVHKCNNCKHQYAFPRYGEILKVAEKRTGRCSEWSMLFGAILNTLGIETRIVHDFLDHCWNEAMLNGKWVHVDSTLTYPISLNHPYYYEQNWGKKYEYILAFSADKVEDVTQAYTIEWDNILQRRMKNNKKKNNTINFTKIYSEI
jgi:hypothetical protein